MLHHLWVVPYPFFYAAAQTSLFQNLITSFRSIILAWTTPSENFVRARDLAHMSHTAHLARPEIELKLICMLAAGTGNRCQRGEEVPFFGLDPIPRGVGGGSKHGQQSMLPRADQGT